MEDIQQSEFIFYIPVIASYAIACLVARQLFIKQKLWNQPEEFKPDKPVIELVIALLAVVAVFMVGRLYSAGYLLPARYNPYAWIANNLIIYSPIFIVLLIRKQPITTVWISHKHIGFKLLVGGVASVISVSVFLTFRMEWERFIEVVTKSFSADALSYFVPVFLEGVAIAFLFVRLKWVSNLKVALAIPGVLFAMGHLPGMIVDGDPWWHMTLMSLVTGSITVFVLYTCYKTRDIIWIGIVHYFMDVAIRAF